MFQVVRTGLDLTSQSGTHLMANIVGNTTIYSFNKIFFTINKMSY